MISGPGKREEATPLTFQDKVYPKQETDTRGGGRKKKSGRI